MPTYTNSYAYQSIHTNWSHKRGVERITFGGAWSCLNGGGHNHRGLEGMPEEITEAIVRRQRQTGRRRVHGLPGKGGNGSRCWDKKNMLVIEIVVFVHVQVPNVCNIQEKCEVALALEEPELWGNGTDSGFAVFCGGGTESFQLWARAREARPPASPRPPAWLGPLLRALPARAGRSGSPVVSADFKTNLQPAIVWFYAWMAWDVSPSKHCDP